MNKKRRDKLFSELYFCTLTTNFNAEKNIKIQIELEECFLTLFEKDLIKKLKAPGYRFPDTRAKNILDSRKYKNLLQKKHQVS